MIDEPGRLGWGEIEEDLEAAKQFKERLLEVFREDRERATRSLERARATRAATGGEPSGVGRELIWQSSTNNQLRCATLRHLEKTFPASLDHGILIGLASQIVETELDRLLATPALAIAPSLIEALSQKKKDREPAETLESWAAKKTWTVLGIESILLLALRRGCEQCIPAVYEFLEAHFTRGYQALVSQKSLGQCLDQIRNQRNAIVHRGAIFDGAGYGDFVFWVFGKRRFALWEQQGPDPAPPGADFAILHHHLHHSRIAAANARPAKTARPEGSKPAPDDPAIAELLTLKPPGPSLLEARVNPLHAGRPREVRGVTVSAQLADPPFVLGDLIRFRIQTDRPCHVVLIDVGTTGETAVLWPNHWHPDTWIDEMGDHFVPALENPECELNLTGVAGTERIAAIATLTPLPLRVLPEPGGSFRSLTTGEIARLVDVLRQQPSGWALSVCSFQVQAP
jgi:Domain of unknown function (DUF4384)